MKKYPQMASEKAKYSPRAEFCSIFSMITFFFHDTEKCAPFFSLFWAHFHEKLFKNGLRKGKKTPRELSCVLNLDTFHQGSDKKASCVLDTLSIDFYSKFKERCPKGQNQGKRDSFPGSALLDTTARQAGHPSLFCHISHQGRGRHTSPGQRGLWSQRGTARQGSDLSRVGHVTWRRGGEAQAWA